MVAIVASTLLVLFVSSQLYWVLRTRALGRRLFPNASARGSIAGLCLAAYLLLVIYNFFGRGYTPTHLTLREALLVAPFQWWVACSVVAFLLVLARRVVRLASPGPEVPARRAFLGNAARMVIGAPFVAGAYGLLYGRLNLETNAVPIHLARLPKAFAGFRIAHLSDIHIGPFMTEEEIRRYVAIANALKPDLIVLTGDFITWDPSTQRAVVSALSGLRAPYGVYGCLGNHDAWSLVEDSLTQLFRQAGIRILRQESVTIPTHGERLNVIGVDYQTRRSAPVSGIQHVVPRYLTGIEKLVMSDTANILLSHNPDTFDRAAELGVDLSLAGHTHGGQVSLEFISPQLAPSRIVTPYVAGWFQKPGGQLYVNRGIGTIGVPIRLGAPPEISVFQLS